MLLSKPTSGGWSRVLTLQEFGVYEQLHRQKEDHQDHTGHQDTVEAGAEQTDLPQGDPAAAARLQPVGPTDTQAEGFLIKFWWTSMFELYELIPRKFLSIITFVRLFQWLLFNKVNWSYWAERRWEPSWNLPDGATGGAFLYHVPLKPLELQENRKDKCK